MIIGLFLAEAASSPFALKGVPLDYDFNPFTNTLGYITQDLKLNLLKFNQKTISSIQLAFPPICVSFDAQGTTAVVGHDAKVTYINLKKNTIVKVYNVPIETRRIILAQNGFAYILDSQTQWTQVYCLDLNSGVTTPNQGQSIYGRQMPRLHPSGSYIYTASNGISPAKLTKLSIQNGTANYLYQQPYHGNYPSGGNLWFDTRGELIFTKPGTVFSSSDNKTQDMLYSGKIKLPNNSSGIRTLQVDDIEGIIYLAFQITNSTSITAVNLTNFLPLYQILLGYQPVDIFCGVSCKAKFVLGKSGKIWIFQELSLQAKQ